MYVGIDAKVGLFANSCGYLVKEMKWCIVFYTKKLITQKQRTEKSLRYDYFIWDLQGIAHIDGWSTSYSGLR